MDAFSKAVSLLVTIGFDPANHVHPFGEHAPCFIRFKHGGFILEHRKITSANAKFIYDRPITVAKLRISYLKIIRTCTFIYNYIQIVFNFKY